MPFIAEQLTADKVREYFAHLVEGELSRFYLPGFHAFNFYLTRALGGGGSASLRLDAQAKTFGQMLLSLPISVDQDLIDV